MSENRKVVLGKLEGDAAYSFHKLIMGKVGYEDMLEIIAQKVAENRSELATRWKEVVEKFNAAEQILRYDHETREFYYYAAEKGDEDENKG